MLKTRIIPTLLWKNVGLVKGVGFDSWRRVGTVLPAIKVYCMRDVDELVLLDIAATQENRCIDADDVAVLAEQCLVPLAVGGGVRSVDDFRRLLGSGADKVSINSAAVAYPQLISRAAAVGGSQCVVVSIDARNRGDGRYEVWTRCATCATGIEATTWAREAEARGAGEILLTSIERDGTMAGYDVHLIHQVAQAVKIPVIASGGAGSYADMQQALTAGASAVAAASIFHFTEQTPLQAKAYLKERGVPVRL